MKSECCASSLACLLVALSPLVAHAQFTVDFDPAGELEARFPGCPAYSENATGGLNSSVGVNLANLAPDNLSGSQAESLAIDGFANGAKFTVGVYFKLSAFGNSVVNSQGTQFLRLGLTNGAGDDFYASNAGFSQLPVADLRIVSYSRDSGTGGSTIVFSSESGADYSLLGGEALTGLAPGVLSIPGTGGDVTVNHTPAGSPPKFFYRVCRN